jgi:nicotinate-nucleotide pyrophosphorylase (carboxylating)
MVERVALNFLSHLSGISTLTSKWVAAIAGTKCQIRDSRKTTPGLRTLEKFATRMGGAINHRFSLSEAALIKDNHIVAAGSISAAFTAIKKRFPEKPIEVEVDSIGQLKEVIELNPDLILLDNMSVELCQEALALVAGRVKIEVSGGLTLENSKAYANAGVTYLAVGSITHSAPALDIGLDFRKVE